MAREKAPDYIAVYGRWSCPGKGRYWKRRLSKVRRRAWKDPRHPRGLRGIESICNYKGW